MNSKTLLCRQAANQNSQPSQKSCLYRRIDQLTPLTQHPSHTNCRVCVVVPVRNEEENLPSTIGALAHQVNQFGKPIDPDSYEVLLLANNCSDRTVEVAYNLSRLYPALHLHIIEVTLPRQQAYVGKARQLVMDEAYRRLSLIGLKGRIIASTDGDTEVDARWIDTLDREFSQGVDAVGGRIVTQRKGNSGITKEMSLYYLRGLAYAFLSVELDCVLNPQPHDRWPRHSQYYGANMSITAVAYEKIGGMPLVRDSEDVALYQKLQAVDAKIRHSVAAKVLTSARQAGRATGGLADYLEQLSKVTETCQTRLVECPQLIEARILLRKQLRSLWMALHQPGELRHRFNIRENARNAELLAKYLGLTGGQLRFEIEQAPTFGQLLTAVSQRQKQQSEALRSLLTIEVKAAIPQLRERIHFLQQQAIRLTASMHSIEDPRIILQTFQKIQAIPIFPSTH